MSTRSLIAKQTPNGFESIYCHFDGYPEHHAPILAEHYATEDKVDALLDLGDILTLGIRLEFKKENGTQAFGRDKGESGVEKASHASEQELFDAAISAWAAYVYLFRNSRWYSIRLHGSAEWVELKTETTHP